MIKNKKNIVTNVDNQIRKVQSDFEMKKHQSLKKLENKNQYLERIRLQNEDLMKQKLLTLKQKQTEAELR